MERGGVSGASKACLSSKEKSDGFCCKTVSCSGTKRNFQKKKKKRAKVIVSDSESSDEFLEPSPSSVDRKTMEGKSSLKEKFAQKRDKVEHDGNRVVRKKSEPSSGLMKMNKLDVFEFDEYDGFDNANLMRKRFDNGNVGSCGRSSFESRKVDSSVGGSGSGKDCLFVKRKKPRVNGTSSMSSQESLSSESDPDEPVRMQARYNVVKVNNKAGTLAPSINHQEAEIHERPLSFKKARKQDNVIVRPTFRKSSHLENDLESVESDDVSRKPECRKSKKEVSTKSKFSAREERRAKLGGGTEKQRLREKIKGLLTDAGWTIDYKPRKSQSYLDTIYVNPSGIAYWSIIKAYDAFQKQLKDEEIDARPRKDAAVVASVSEDIMNSLARKVKKTETDMTKKWNKGSSGSDSDGEVDSDTREERKGSSVNLARKSKKRGRKETGRYDLHSRSKRYSSYSHARPSSRSDSHYLHGRKSKNMGRCTLKVRSSQDKKNPAIDGFNPYSVKRTLLSWLLECGVVKLRQKVQYMNRQCTKVMLEGWITRVGIHCVCCSKIVPVSRFEIHAGSKLSQPFQNIYLESGRSLLQCLIRAWNRQTDVKNIGFHHVETDGDDPNDDACGICGDGGDLICCDGCPSTYHQTCLGMEVLPSGDWHCPNCTCKFCDAAMDSGSEDKDHLSLLSCNMCERRYHQSCMSELEAHKVHSFDSTSSFCGPKCLELFEKLQKFLGVKNVLEGGYSWSLVHRVDTDSNSNSQLSAQRIQNNSKLAVGLAIMDECFLPIIDQRSGVNLIRNVLYNCGSNFNRINFTGFYTAILERGDEIISAASLRFHGIQLAEMPFIGTRHLYRRQGMCRRLFDAIELAMRSLKVEILVIPAIPDFLHAWTGNFGFSHLDDSVRKEMRSINTLVFPGIDILQKHLLHEENVIAVAPAGDCVVVHKDAMNSEIETEMKSEFTSSADEGLHSNGHVDVGADCYKNTLVSDEENTSVSVETAMDTISKLKGEETGKKQCEDTGSSCVDVSVEAVASLVPQETLQPSTDFQVENNASSSISGVGSSDVSSISQETKSEQNSTNGDAIPCCKDNDILAIEK
ncbi:unnamed protein product [Cochlearia groenlandica]